MALVALLEMFWPLVIFRFDVPDQVVPCWNMAKNPEPLGSAAVRLVSTAETPAGVGVAAKIPATVAARGSPPPTAPPAVPRTKTPPRGSATPSAHPANPPPRAPPFPRSHT